jgi:hypothetical protein
MKSDWPDTMSCALPSVSPETHLCLPSCGPGVHDAEQPLPAQPLPPGCVQTQAVPRICGPEPKTNKPVTARSVLHISWVTTIPLFLVIPAFPQMPVAKVVFPLGAWPFQNNPPSSLVTLVSVATHAVLSAVPLLLGQLSVQHLWYPR